MAREVARIKGRKGSRSFITDIQEKASHWRLSMKTIRTFISILLLLPTFTIAHGGRTDASGCHNDRKNGGYHCHNSGTHRQSPRATTNSVNTNSANPQSLTAQPASSQVREANIAAYKDLVLKTQTALNQLGYSAGEPDGVLGEQTVKAIKHFQVDSEIAVDGKPSYLLLNVLLGKVG